MSQQQSVMVVSEIEFRVSISGDTDLESVFDALADELASLEDATMGLLDSTVSMLSLIHISEPTRPAA